MCCARSGPYVPALQDEGAHEARVPDPAVCEVLRVWAPTAGQYARANARASEVRNDLTDEEAENVASTALGAPLERSRADDAEPPAVAITTDDQAAKMVAQAAAVEEAIGEPREDQAVVPANSSRAL